jgi:hypothetical protein
VVEEEGECFARAKLCGEAIEFIFGWRNGLPKTSSLIAIYEEEEQTTVSLTSSFRGVVQTLQVEVDRVGILRLVRLRERGSCAYIFYKVWLERENVDP